MGSEDAGGSGSGLLWTRQHSRVRAREQWTGLKWLTAGGSGCGCKARGAQGRGGSGGNMNGTKMSTPPPPPPPPPFYRAVGQPKGLGVAERPNFDIVAKFLLHYFPSTKSTKI